MISECIERLKGKAVDRASGILAAAANSKGDPMPIARNSDEWRVCEELERLQLLIKEVNVAAHKTAVKWWKRHCDTNKNMELTKDAHADLCAIERATRQPQC